MVDYEKYIDKQLLELENKGSLFNKEWLNEIKKEILSGFKIGDVDDAFNQSVLEICNCTIDLINSKELSGIATGIYIQKDSINIYAGKTDYESNNLITENTLFDIASITKLFTLLLTFKLEEMGLLDLDVIVHKLNPDFKLKNFTLNDLIKMVGLIETETRIDKCDNYEQAYETLKTLSIKDSNKKENTYTDMGMIVLSKTIEKVISEQKKQNLTFDQIMDMYLLKPLGLNNTTFFPTQNIAGNGYKTIRSHDQKNYLLGPIGSAGLFTNNNDLYKLFYKLYHTNYLSDYHLEKLYKKITPQKALGYAGINLKHPLGISKTFAPNEYSSQVYAHQGFTGSVVINDPINQIHHSFLVSTIKENEKVKPKNFMKNYNQYQLAIIKESLIMLVTKKMYQHYYDYDEKIVKEIHLY